MIGLTIKIVGTDDATTEVTITPKVAVGFERHFKTSLAKALAEERKFEHVYWLGWEATRQSGTVVKPFDQWLEQIASAEFVFGDDPKD